MLRIVTDTASDITVDQARNMNIDVVSLDITFEDGPAPQRTEEDFRRFYQRLEACDRLPVTSRTPPEEYLNLFQDAREKGDDVLVITLSGGLSGTVDSARMAKQIADYDKIEVVDSHQAILTQRMLVEQAVKLREEGYQLQEIVQRIKNTRDQVVVCGVVDTLKYLQKGGRIGKVTATAGMLLQIKPILAFAPDGQLTSVAKVRGRHQVIDKLVALTVQRCGEHKRYNLAVANGGAPEEMAIVKEKLTAALPDYDHIWEGEIDGTLSVYIGDGILGAAVQVLD